VKEEDWRKDTHQEGQAREDGTQPVPITGRSHLWSGRASTSQRCLR